jgi:aminotransferase
MINLFEPHVGYEELAAIEEVFASRWLGMGDRVGEFETAFAEYVGCPPNQLLAVTSCTEGLFHAIDSLDLGPGDEVILPTVSFIGAAHAVRNTGATVVLCDVDPQTLNPTPEHVERAIGQATRAVLILHYGGAPGAAGEISDLARERSLMLIEDAAVGLGSKAGGRACGLLGEIGVWSFDAMKVLTTGDGGMVWCRDAECAARIRRSVKLGLGVTGFQQRGNSRHWWQIDPHSCGRRGAMNSVSAAMGIVQLGKLDRFLRRRDEIALNYDLALRRIPWLEIPAWPSADAARAFYWIQTQPETRDRLAAHLLSRDVYTTYKYWPLHRTHMYASDHQFPGADQAAASTLLLPLHQGLTDADVGRVIQAVREFDSAVQ